MTDDERVEAFLEHWGVKGMRWGVRTTKRIQRRTDAVNRLSKGRASISDRRRALLGPSSGLVRGHVVLTKRGANRVLQRYANKQEKIKAGKFKIYDRLAVVGGKEITSLNFHRKGNPNAKLDIGEKAIRSILVADGALRIATLGLA